MAELQSYPSVRSSLMERPRIPCVSDLPSTMSQRRLGQRIARQRMLQPNPRDLCEDGSAAIWRGSSLHGTTIQDPSYRQVAFLTPHDVVLAADTAGSVDIVRLPRYWPPDDDDSSNRASFRPMGTKVAGKVDMRPLHRNLGSVALQSLQGGQAFVVGLPSGELRVFATEHASTYSRSNEAVSQHPSSALQVRGKRYIAPRRRYHRDEQIQSHSLLRMLQSFDGHSFQYMNEIPDWMDTTLPMRAVHRTERRDERPSYHDLQFDAAENSSWDFRETQSGLLAAFVDPEKDCFSLRVMDDRLPPARLQRSIVCVDAETKANGSLGQEHITSVSFVSDHTLATSHVWHLDKKNKHCSSAVKLWDIRKLNRGNAKPLVENVLPSFPLESARTVTPDDTMHFLVDDEVASCVSCLENRERSNSYLITNLSSSSEGVGTVMVTLHSWNCNRLSGNVHHLQFDPIRQSIVRKYKSPEWTYKSLSKHIVTPMQDYSACYELANEKSTISFYDLTKTTRGKMGSPTGCAGDSNPSRRKKRSQDERDKALYDRSTECELVGKIDAPFKDQYGLNAQVSCMAFNEVGTALIAGCMDGNLFVLRGG